MLQCPNPLYGTWLAKLITGDTERGHSHMHIFCIENYVQFCSQTKKKNHKMKFAIQISRELLQWMRYQNQHSWSVTPSEKIYIYILINAPVLLSVGLFLVFRTTGLRLSVSVWVPSNCCCRARYSGVGSGAPTERQEYRKAVNIRGISGCSFNYCSQKFPFRDYFESFQVFSDQPLKTLSQYFQVDKVMNSEVIIEIRASNCFYVSI